MKSCELFQRAIFVESFNEKAKILNCKVERIVSIDDSLSYSFIGLIGDKDSDLFLSEGIFSINSIKFSFKEVTCFSISFLSP